jgi:hypothetical protein
MNGSLFATEGVASVGPFICGLAIALGNKVSADLLKPFILTSAAIMPQFLLNVPFTTTLLSNGLAFFSFLVRHADRVFFSGPAGAVNQMRRETER